MNASNLSVPHEALAGLSEIGEWLRLLIESVSEYAIFSLDRAGIVTTWNAGADRLTGYPASEIVGRHFSVFYSSEDVAAGKPQVGLQRALADGRFTDQGSRVRKDGSFFWADVVITPIYDDARQHKGFAKLTRDLTERRRGEEERIRLARTEEAVRVREEFMAIAAHELRTPVNILQLQLLALKLILKPGHDTQLDREQVAGKVERLLHATDRVTKLIARLYDVSRISSGRLAIDRQPMDLVACVKSVVASLQERLAAKQAEMHFRAPDEAPGEWDRMRIDEVVYNLIENAITYGKTPIHVLIAVDEQFVFLDVTDQGSGIAAKDRDRVFERFAVGGSDSSTHGLGLGLYISRLIVEAHGGEIDLKDSGDSGTHFQIRLPRKAINSSSNQLRLGLYDTSNTIDHRDRPDRR